MSVDSQFGIYDLEIVGNNNTSIDTEEIDYTSFVLWFTDSMPSDISDFKIIVSINNTPYTLPFKNSGYGSSNDFIASARYYATFSNNLTNTHDKVSDGSSITVQVLKSNTVMGNWSGVIKINPNVIVVS